MGGTIDEQLHNLARYGEGGISPRIHQCIRKVASKI